MDAKFGTIRDYIPGAILGAFWLFALMNPVFKKYDYGGGLPLVVGLGVLVFVIAIFEFNRKRERNLWEQIFLMIFAVAVVISFFLSEMRSFGLSEVLAFLSVVTVYLLIADRKIEWTDGFLKAVALGGIFAVVVGGILYVTRGEVRMFGPFFNKLYPGHVWPNAFALFLLMVWPLYVFYLKKRSALEISFVLGLVFSALLLSFSRGAFLVLCGQILLLGFYYMGRFKIKTIVAMFLTVALTAGFFWGLNELRLQNHPVIDVVERAGFENHEDLTSKRERLDFWEGSVELTKDRPFFGWGPFSFRYAYNPIQKEFLASSDHSHNIFLKISSENGLIALASFLFFLLLWFRTVTARFRKLDNEKQDLICILGISVAGAFAHNMIDYNFNFVVNILLLFLFLAFIRSLVVEKDEKTRRAYFPLLLAIIVAAVSIYEGVLFTKHFTGDEEALNKSFFPRYHYLTMADEALSTGDYEKALIFLDKETSLSPLSAQAWYLKGVVYCKEDYDERDPALCKKYFGKALDLNPMNDFNYYHDYFRQLVKEKSPEIHPMLEVIKPLLENYFFYVEYNVHFTSYTHNVEVAASLVDSILPYLSSEEAEFFKQGKERMLKTSARQRAEKLF